MAGTPTTFFQSGTNFFLGQDNPSVRHKTLPTFTYLLKFDPDRGQFYLSVMDNFELPSKLYGTLDKKADRILNTFNDRSGTTGVLLEGEKGSGKTLLTKLISTKALKQDIPTILINWPANGDRFSEFLQSIEQPIILLFDEFEKTYDAEAQKGLLTLLDGVFTSKKLFLFTSNDHNAIDNHMKNRPGRIYYALKFEGLDPEFVVEYGQDRLKNKTHVNNLAVLAGLVRPLNFDMLKAVVEECNRYEQSPMETLDMLNVRTSSYPETFVAKLTIPGIEVTRHEGCDENGMRVNPLNTISVDYYYNTPVKVKGKIMQEDIYGKAIFRNNDLLAMEGVKGIYKYKNREGQELTLTRKILHATDYKQVKNLTEDPNSQVVEDAPGPVVAADRGPGPRSNRSQGTFTPKPIRLMKASDISDIYKSLGWGGPNGN
jgi:hypothetical protein